jgi:hypothetical protein
MITKFPHTISSGKFFTDFDKRVFSLMCFYCQSKNDLRTTLLLHRVYQSYSTVGRNTDNSQTLRVPHGSRPHGHDRNLALCVNHPAFSVFVPQVTVLVQKLNNNSHHKCKRKSPKKTRPPKSVVP